jgi:hypothetical protein
LGQQRVLLPAGASGDAPDASGRRKRASQPNAITDIGGLKKFKGWQTVCKTIG